MHHVPCAGGAERGCKQYANFLSCVRSARFGPNGIRKGSRRLGVDRINVPAKIRVSDHLDIVDCGDVRTYPSSPRVRHEWPRSPISMPHTAMVLTDNKVALRQLELANMALLSGAASRSYAGKSLAKDGGFHPRVLTLGGDHTNS